MTDHPSRRTDPADPTTDAIADPTADPTAPTRPPGMGGGVVGPDVHPGDYGASEDEQRRVQGQPDSDRRDPTR